MADCSPIGAPFRFFSAWYWVSSWWGAYGRLLVWSETPKHMFFGFDIKTSINFYSVLKHRKSFLSTEGSWLFFISNLLPKWLEKDRLCILISYHDGMLILPSKYDEEIAECPLKTDHNEFISVNIKLTLTTWDFLFILSLIAGSLILPHLLQ